MSAPLNAIGIANRALALFGAGAIQSFDQTLPPGPAVALRYDDVIGGLLSEVPWSFTMETVPLAQVSPDQTDGLTQNMEGWRYAHALPANLLELPSAYLDSRRMAEWPVRRFAVQSGVVYSDEPTLYAVCRVRADESVWPPYFVTAAVACLAAELIMAVSGDAGWRDRLQAEAWGTPEQGRQGGKLGQAKTIDARNRGTQVMRANPLIDARYA